MRPVSGMLLQAICKKHDIVYCIDEVQTGCGPTGKMWAYEHFGLDGPPDILTFSKKMLTGGFYYKSDLRVKQGFRIFNTWVGEPSELEIQSESRCHYLIMLMHNP